MTNQWRLRVFHLLPHEFIENLRNVSFQWEEKKLSHNIHNQLSVHRASKSDPEWDMFAIFDFWTRNFSRTHCSGRKTRGPFGSDLDTRGIQKYGIIILSSYSVVSPFSLSSRSEYLNIGTPEKYLDRLPFSKQYELINGFPSAFWFFIRPMKGKEESLISIHMTTICWNRKPSPRNRSWFSDWEASMHFG